MTPERWQKIGEIYHAAIELEKEERAEFLSQACAADAELRREVESLIAAEEQAGDFIASPALKDAARLMSFDQSSTLTLHRAEQAGHYIIKELLGRGGMGEVYLAQDTRLGRQVALKVLPPESKNDQRERKRLLREARSAASLNHPNIVTIYAIEELDGSVFIVMEYVEGKTLMAMITANELRFAQLLEAVARIADALTAAHSAGVIHRDVKPSNVIITPDGQAKLLDFGLAKLTRPILGEAASEAEPHSLSAEGAVVGTVAYMSPEQVHGEELDGRTDIFSLGAVLYEAVTGKRPFNGSNALSIAYQIAAKEPSPPSTLKQDLPPELDHIIERAMAKDKARRFQSASELARELRLLKGKAAYESDPLSGEETLVPKAARESDSGKPAINTQVVPYMTGPIPMDQKTDADSMKRAPVITIGQKTAFLFTAAALVAVLVGAFALYKLFDRAPVGNKSSELPATTETRLTNSGNIASARASISPDGRYVAYATQDTLQTSSLWVRQLAAASSAQIIPSAGVVYGGTTFSPDGNYIYYTVREKLNTPFTLYRIPLLGGASKKIIEDVDSPVSFSPDGNRFVFRRNFYWRSESALFVANADGSDEHKIAAVRSPEFFGDPAWSPDGRVIACGSGHADGGANRYVVEISVPDWQLRPVSQKKWRWVGGMEWLSDGKGLLMIAANNPAEPYRVWHLSYPDGEVRQITNNTALYSRLSLAADSNALLVAHLKRSTHLWIVPNEDPRAARKMAFGAGGYRSNLRWTPDGKIIFDSEMAGTPDISIMNEDGSNHKQLLGDLTKQATSYYPSVTPDGRRIVFAFDITGKRHIWRMDLDGGNLTQLTNGGGEDQPHCSPDGKWVVYVDIGSPKETLWKVPIEGGEPVQLTRTFSKNPSVSPDGKLIACYYSSEADSPRWAIALIPFDGGEPVKMFTQTVHNSYPTKWAPDGRNLAYIDAMQSNVWMQPVQGGEPKRLTDFNDDLMFGFEWSPDGKRLACIRGIWEKDLIVIRNFQPGRQ